MISATLLILSSSRAQAQTYLNATGLPTFATLAPIENGFLNLANGNPHLEFELGTFPQRGKKQLTAKLVYEGRIWQIVNGAWLSCRPASAAPW